MDRTVLALLGFRPKLKCKVPCGAFGQNMLVQALKCGLCQNDGYAVIVL